MISIFRSIQCFIIFIKTKFDIKFLGLTRFINTYIIRLCKNKQEFVSTIIQRDLV